MTIPMTEPLWEHLEFPVSLQPIRTQTPEGEEVLVENAQAVFREDSKTTLDVVSQGYVLIPHGEIYRPFFDLMRGEDLPFNLVGVHTQVGMGGGYAKVEWLFDETVEVRFGDHVQISLLTLNSLDRSASLRAELSARRLICSNGLRGPGPSFGKAWPHRGTLVIRDVFEWIKRAFKFQVPAMIGTWQEWDARKIFVTRVEEFLDEDPMTSGVLGKKAREGIILRLQGPKGREKVSVWEAYNGITEYASHRVKTRKADLFPLRQEQIHRAALRFADWVMEG